MDDLEGPIKWKFTEPITFHYCILLAYPALIPRVQKAKVDQTLYRVNLYKQIGLTVTLQCVSCGFFRLYLHHVM